MFLHRLKTEFSENLKLTLALWVCYVAMVWSFIAWWSAPLDPSAISRSSGGGLFFLVFGILYFLVSTMFKRDDLKNPEDFWATRPIRALPFFGAKLVLAWLVIAVPAGVLMVCMSLGTGMGGVAVLHGLEAMLWLGFMTSLLALSCMAYSGGSRSLFGVIGFFGALIACLIFLSRPSIEGRISPFVENSSQIIWNLLVVLVVSVACWILLCIRQLRDKHRRTPFLLFVMVGMCIPLFVIFIPVPGKTLPSNVDTKFRSLPTIHEASMDPRNVSIGTENGARYMGTSIDLLPVGIPADAELELVSVNLKIVGRSEPWLWVVNRKFSDSRFQSLEDDRTVRIGLRMYDHFPGTNGSLSSEQSRAKSDLVAALPRETLHLAGTITLKKFTYRELSRGPINQSIAHNIGGLQALYFPKSSSDTLTQEREGGLILKRFSPPLVTAIDPNSQPLIRLQVADPGSENAGLFPMRSRSNRSSGSGFGSDLRQTMVVSEHELARSGFWAEIQRHGYEKSMGEWLNDANVVLEVIDQIEVLEVPVDVKIEVPDTHKIRELLIDGTL